MHEPPPPEPTEKNPFAYWSIVSISALLCFAWLFTGSIVLTMIIIVLGLLHLAQFFPDAEAVIADDPILLLIRRYTFVIIFLIAGIVIAIRNLQ